MINSYDGPVIGFIIGAACVLILLITWVIYDKKQTRRLEEALRQYVVRCASYIHVPDNYNWVPEMEEGAEGIEK